MVALDLTESDGAGLVALLRAVWSRSCLSNWAHVSSAAQTRQSVSQAQNVRRLPESLLLPTLDLPPRDGRALLRLVGDLGDMAGVGYGWMRRGNARGGRRQGAFTS